MWRRKRVVRALYERSEIDYRQFVKEGLQDRPWDEVRGQIYLGSQRFIEEQAGEAKADPEIPRAQLNPSRPSLDEIFAIPGKKVIEKAYIKHGYTMKEIGEHLGVHHATVSRRN